MSEYDACLFSYVYHGMATSQPMVSDQYSFGKTVYRIWRCWFGGVTKAQECGCVAETLARFVGGLGGGADQGGQRLGVSGQKVLAVWSVDVWFKRLVNAGSDPELWATLWLAQTETALEPCVLLSATNANVSRDLFARESRRFDSKGAPAAGAGSTLGEGRCVAVFWRSGA